MTRVIRRILICLLLATQGWAEPAWHRWLLAGNALGGERCGNQTWESRPGLLDGKHKFISDYRDELSHLRCIAQPEVNAQEATAEMEAAAQFTLKGGTWISSKPLDQSKVIRAGDESRSYLFHDKSHWVWWFFWRKGQVWGTTMVISQGLTAQQMSSLAKLAVARGSAARP